MTATAPITGTATAERPTTAPVLGPDFVALMVRDLDASRRFYTERLGLRPAPHAPPGAVVFDTRPVPFAVRTPAPGVDLAAAAAVGVRAGVGVALWLGLAGTPAAADALCDALAAAGVPVLARPQDGPFGRFFQVADPDGYAVTLHATQHATAPATQTDTTSQDAPRTTLDPANHYVTLVNTFEVAPERAEELLELLARATEQVLRHLPGFVSANLHVSLDRTRVANYAQWRSREAYEAALADAGARAHMRQAAQAAERFTPVLYELRHAIAAG